MLYLNTFEISSVFQIHEKEMMFQSLSLDTYLALLKTLEKRYDNSVIRAIVNSYMVCVKVL